MTRVRMKKLFIDIPSALMMMICFTTALFIVLNVAELIGKIAHERKEINRFEYSIDTLLDIYDSKKPVNDLLEYLMGNKQANIYLTDIKVFINDEPVNYVCNIILNTYEDFNFKSFLGDKINIYQDNIGCVLIGQTMAEYLTNVYNNNTEIQISGQSLPVIDILQNNMSGGIDNSVWIIWDKIPLYAKETLLQVIAEQLLLRVSFKSNMPLNEVYDDFCFTMGEEWGSQPIIFEASYDGAYQNLWHQSYGALYNGLSLIFAIAAIFVAVKLWLLRRQKEIVIRIIYGYSTVKIASVLLIDILKIIGLAMVFALVLQFIYCYVFDVSIDITSQLPVKFGIVLLGVILLMMLMFHQLVHQIGNTSIVEGLSRDN